MGIHSRQEVNRNHECKYVNDKILFFYRSPSLSPSPQLYQQWRIFHSWTQAGCDASNENDTKTIVMMMMMTKTMTMMMMASCRGKSAR